MAITYPIVSGVTFKDVVEFIDYCVGNDGSFWRSKQYKTIPGNPRKWIRVLTSRRKRDGYVKVSFNVNKKRFHRYAHRIVLESFLGPCPLGMEACHNNGDKLDNRLSNLRWDTKKNNQADRVAHGTKIEGSKVKNSSTNEPDVISIKKLLRLGIKHRIIACQFNVSKAVIDGISSGKSWRHVKINEENA